MFLFFAVLESVPDSFRAKLRKMAVYLEALLGPAGEIPLLGDDDGGRFFHPFGARNQFGRATLAACAVFLDDTHFPREAQDLHPLAAWWWGEAALRKKEPRQASTGSQWFPDAGVAVMAHQQAQLVCDTRAFGMGSSGHSHAHSLSLVCRTGEHEILIDSGTFSYVDPQFRNMFRGTGSHNTVRIGGADQARPSGLFRWEQAPASRLLQWTLTPAADFLSAECRQLQGTHWRRILFLKPHLWIVLDQVEAETSQLVEQFWHFANPVQPVAPGSFSVAAGASFGVTGGDVEIRPHWRSLAYGHKQESHCVRVASRIPTSAPCRIAAWVDLSGAVRGIEMEAGEKGCVRVRLHGPTRKQSILFPPEGLAHSED
jgi:hypothetical protein